MAGRRRKTERESEFWCINCGRKGIPIMRERCHRREKGHRKALYCIHCRTVINHVEIRNPEEAERFLADFAAGKYAEEAAKSIDYGEKLHG